jgi:transcription antitermination factor NusG
MTELRIAVPNTSATLTEIPPVVLPWFGIHVRSKCEAQVDRHLRLRDLESFLPLRRVRHRWSDRTKVVDEPLFPGYLFCRIDLTEHLRVLSVPGVVDIVSIGKSPAPIDGAEIQSIQALVASAICLTPSPCVSVGQRVRIERGPLMGVEGIIARTADGKPRLVVSVMLLNRAVSAEIEREWIDAL